MLMSDSTASESKAAAAARAETRFTIPADMALYAALVGKTPEIDPTLADPLTAATEARRENPWSPMVLSIYLRQVCIQQALKINKPEVAAWVQKQSSLARRRILETQARVRAIQNGRAA
jgi:hypothetical protein